jgi:pimeloyl-ACP methyl ester carboxylesterase
VSTVRSSDGTAIAYDSVGAGPALVVVDGAFSHRAVNRTSARLAELLAPRFTVYRYDRRGRGQSGDASAYAVAREVEDMQAVVAAAGGAAFVLGGSSGAVLALDAAAHTPAITRLAVYEPPFIVDASRPAVADDYPARLQALVAAGRPGDAVALFFTEAVRVPPSDVAAMRGQPFWSEIEQVAPTLRYDAEIMAGTMRGAPLPAGRWAAVTAPTLVLNGGGGAEFMRAGADALAAILPHAQRRSLPGQTHDVAAEVLAPALVEFFSA